MIKYVDSSHTYTSLDGKISFMSGTTFIKQFEEPKDWKKIEEAYAKKYNKKVKKETGVDPKTTGDYWRHVWDEKKNKAAERGTAFHLQQEQAVMDMYQTMPKFVSKIEGNDIKFSLDTLKLQDGVYPELIVWLNSAQIAGQADLVIIKDNVINIADYKTNSSIEIEPYIRWDGTFDTFKPPISHLPETKGYKYFLQLNLYAYMIKKHNPKFKIGELTLRHIEFDENDNPIGYKDIQCPLLQDEIKAMIRHREEELLFL